MCHWSIYTERMASTIDQFEDGWLEPKPTEPFDTKPEWDKAIEMKRDRYDAFMSSPGSESVPLGGPVGIC